MAEELKAGRYKVTREVGRGGMGVVYCARDTRLGRMVALKMLPAEVTNNSELHRRMVQEAHAASALSHPGVATVYDFVDEGGETFIVYEFVEGIRLRDKLRPQGLATDEILAIGIQLADALVAAHEHGIVHRDLKPENIMLTPSPERAGRVKILDFGLAKWRQPLAPVAQSKASTAETGSVGTAPGLLVGTVNYMTPEQLEGDPADARSDLHALGLVLYEMATGSNPFVGKTSTSTIANILKQDAPPVRATNPVVPAELDRILRKCLRKKREERYQSARELLVDLSNLRHDVGRAPQPAFDETEPAEAGLLRRLFAFVGPSLRRWWELNHLFGLVVYPLLAYGGWKVKDQIAGPYALPLFFGLLLTAAISTTLRMFFLVTAAFNPDGLAREVRRLSLDLRAASVGSWAVLLVMAVFALSHAPGLSALVMALAVGGLLGAILTEPAIERGAFRHNEFYGEAAEAGQQGAEIGILSRIGNIFASTPTTPLEISRGQARVLFLLIQVAYLGMYGVAFYKFPKTASWSQMALGDEFGKWLFLWLLVAGLAGTPLRLYLISAVGFDYANSGRLFCQMFPLVLLCDLAWAVAPLPLYPKLGLVVLLLVPALAYLPFSQRTVVLTAYASSGGRTSGINPPGSL